jgi:hypothetical protein
MALIRVRFLLCVDRHGCTPLAERLSCALGALVLLAMLAACATPSADKDAPDAL